MRVDYLNPPNESKYKIWPNILQPISTDLPILPMLVKVLSMRYYFKNYTSNESLLITLSLFHYDFNLFWILCTKWTCKLGRHFRCWISHWRKRHNPVISWRQRGLIVIDWFLKLIHVIYKHNCFYLWISTTLLRAAWAEAGHHFPLALMHTRSTAAILVGCDIPTLEERRIKADTLCPELLCKYQILT